MKRYGPKTVRQVPPEFQNIYAHGVGISSPQQLLFLSGQIGIAPDGTTPSSFEDQCRQAMDNVEALLEDADMTLAHILRVTYYLTDAKDLPALTQIRRERWRAEQAPAVTTLVVAALANPDLRVEIEVTAAI
ncbi:RidA family protein [Hoeflea prorocentri]|uniref:RidA family protein n=1 Tax=Hoeflea prorocentri TaxID=1922333 RepID=A0A9X3UIT5_9HYPH|nr:RidA family protein [Hoeflea prorocentri]MCY6382127.1 RidA family protein [Hoeflea prorocentri]MDA5399927.1 RidA family protein [Hoeflea prorocentri]